MAVIKYHAIERDAQGKIIDEQWVPIYADAINNRLRKDSNLKDLQDVSAARKNLGLTGDVSDHNHDTRYSAWRQADQKVNADARAKIVTDLSKSITDTRALVNTKFEEAKKSFTSLNSATSKSITTEKSDRVTADDALSTRIDAEKKSREDADKTLLAKINQNATEITNIKNFTNTGSVLYKKINEIINNINGLAARIKALEDGAKDFVQKGTFDTKIATINDNIKDIKNLENIDDSLLRANILANSDDIKCIKNLHSSINTSNLYKTINTHESILNDTKDKNGKITKKGLVTKVSDLTSTVTNNTTAITKEVTDRKAAITNEVTNRNKAINTAITNAIAIPDGVIHKDIVTTIENSINGKDGTIYKGVNNLITEATQENGRIHKSVATEDKALNMAIKNLIRNATGQNGIIYSSVTTEGTDLNTVIGNLIGLPIAKEARSRDKAINTAITNAVAKNGTIYTAITTNKEPLNTAVNSVITSSLEEKKTTKDGKTTITRGAINKAIYNAKIEAINNIPTKDPGAEKGNIWIK